MLTMGDFKSSKLNQLVSEWPRGCVLTASYLNSIGIKSPLIEKYKNGNWIRQISRGAYILQGDMADWTGGLCALQTQQELNIHAGGKTALEMTGYAHYISGRPRQVFLYGTKGLKLPAWFHKHDWNVDLVYCSTSLFPEECREGLTTRKEKEYSFTISSAERAAMEMLYHVPSKVGFDEAMHVMENLSGLRSKVVQDLLEVCNSIKVKRLFAYLAKRHALPWVKKIDLDSINFGKGKRVIVSSGILDKEFLITVPKTEEEARF